MCDLFESNLLDVLLEIELDVFDLIERLIELVVDDGIIAHFVRSMAALGLGALALCSPDSPIAPIAGSRMTEGHLCAADRRRSPSVIRGGIYA